MKKIQSKMVVIISGIGLLIGSMLSETILAQPSTSSIGMVNIPQVLQQSKHVTELRDQLESQFKDRKEKLDSAQKSFKLKSDALEHSLNAKLSTDSNKEKRESSIINDPNNDSEEKIKKMQKEISQERAALIKQAVSYQQDLDHEQAKILQTIMHDLNHIISGIAKQKHLSLVLDSQAIIYAPNKANDMTKIVIEQFDRQYLK